MFLSGQQIGLNALHTLLTVHMYKSRQFSFECDSLIVVVGPIELAHVELEHGFFGAYSVQRMKVSNMCFLFSLSRYYLKCADTFVALIPNSRLHSSQLTTCKYKLISSSKPTTVTNGDVERAI
jgi:hypothetical protein